MQFRSPGRGWFSAYRVFLPVLAGLAVLFLFNLFYNPAFFRIDLRDGHFYGSLIDILNQGAKVMLLALGMTLVIATGGVDLSVGSVMAIAGAIASLLVTQTEMWFPLILAIALAAGSLAGLCNGFLVGFARIQPIVATLILMVAGRGAAMLITGGQIITFEHPSFVFIGNGHLAGLPFSVVIVQLLLLSTLLVLGKTAIGLFVQSTGDNERATRYAGVNTRAVTILVYAFSGLTASVAGLIATSNIKAADSSRVGEMLELDAIFAVVVGGTALTGGRFTLVGSVLGALLIQTLTTTMYNLGVAPATAPVPKAVLIVAVCLLQSPKFRGQIRGLFSFRFRSSQKQSEAG